MGGSRGWGSPAPAVPQALSRALVNVGGKLTHARDVRDFFVDLVEKVRGTPTSGDPEIPGTPGLGLPRTGDTPPKCGGALGSPQVIEPCRSDKWSPGDLRLFLTQYTAAPRNLPGFR